MNIDPPGMNRNYQVRTRLCTAPDLLSKNRTFIAWYRAGLVVQDRQEQPTKTTSMFSSPVFTVLYERETKPFGSRDDAKDPLAVQFHIPVTIPENQLLLWAVELWRCNVDGESER